MRDVADCWSCAGVVSLKGRAGELEFNRQEAYSKDTER